MQFRWYCLCLKSVVPWVYPQVAAFLAAQGRMKFVRPLYRALSRCSDTGRQVAIDTFALNRLKYHPIARKMVEQDFKGSVTTHAPAQVQNTLPHTMTPPGTWLFYRNAFFVTILAILCLQLALFVYSTLFV